MSISDTGWCFVTISLTCFREPVDQFLEPIARTGKSLDQFPTQIARTDMSYVTAILYPRAMFRQ